LAIEGQRFFDAPNFQSDVVDTDEPRLVVQFFDCCHVCRLPIRRISVLTRRSPPKLRSEKRYQIFCLISENQLSLVNYDRN